MEIVMEEKVEGEKEKYNVIWRDCSICCDSNLGEELAPFFFDGFKGEISAGQTVTDFGCGTAQVAKEFVSKGLNVILVDISPYCLDEEIRHMLTPFSHQIDFRQACLWSLPKEIKPSDWIYCCDALEHIPEKKISTTLEQMAARMDRGGYFSICLRGDLAGNGASPVHLTVKGRDYWEEKLSEHFKIIGVDAVADDVYLNVRVSLR